MQTHILEQDATHAKVSVEVSAQDVSKTYDTIYRALAKQVRISGFRPGKAPRRVLEAKVGRDSIESEVKDALMGHYYPQAMRELSLTPVHAHFHAETPVEGESYSFEVHLELYPEVTLPDLHDIIIDSEAQPLTDAMVEEAVASLQGEHATHVPVERPVEPGDYLMVSTGGENVMPIDLERVGDRLAERFLGKVVGEDVALSLAGPEAATDEAETGEQAETDPDKTDPAKTPLTVTITDIKAKEKPEPDDDFAKTLGFDDWQAALTAIRRNLQTQLSNAGVEAQQEEFVGKLVELSEVPLPEALVERRKGMLLGNLENELKGQGMTLESYTSQLEAQGRREGFNEELQESAERAVKRDLVLEKLLEVRGTTLSNDEFENALQYMAMRSGTDVARFKKELGEQGVANYRFLLTRDKAVREALRELVGEPEADEPDPTPAVAETSTEHASEHAADAAAES